MSIGTTMAGIATDYAYALADEFKFIKLSFWCAFSLALAGIFAGLACCCGKV
jgi:hypothetical protein